MISSDLNAKDDLVNNNLVMRATMEKYSTTNNNYDGNNF